ncbi:MAG: hypothetical protein B7X90_03495 [Novosphingobium sp. 17-62-19]|uniref:helix-turn-helix domain-containing protein n=1 Tax=Novosphingobium sp. 17-62-19 TaxID=1970406 RepID=UPI000BD8F6C9|nr:MAG: hypothetical protein B7X90_03495 [Novosphingobium sp. 17-62-19]
MPDAADIVLKSAITEVGVNNITPRQVEIVSLLLQNSPKPVSVENLCSCFIGKSAINRSTLRVLISNLRSIIRKDLEIIYCYPSSYALKGFEFEESKCYV